MSYFLNYLYIFDKFKFKMDSDLMVARDDGNTQQLQNRDDENAMMQTPAN